MITGVLGPESNAHGPNEFLHIGMYFVWLDLISIQTDMGKRLTGCIASIVADHYAEFK